MRRLLSGVLLLALLSASLLGVIALGDSVDPPNGVVLGWTMNDVHHTMSFSWYTSTAEAGDTIYYDTQTRNGDATAYAYSVTSDEPPEVIIGRKGDEEGYTHKVTVTGLEPYTDYYFVVGGSGGYSKELKFRTIPEDLNSITFVVGGDTRQGALGFPEGRNTISKLMAKHDPYFVIHVGDYIERAFEASEWKELTDHIQDAWITSTGYSIPIVPVIGNHEVGRTAAPEGDYTAPEGGFYEFEVASEDARLYYQFLNIPDPKLWYSLDIVPYLRFFGLNSETYTDPTMAETEQYDWFKNSLIDAQGVTWKIAGFHRPPFAEYGGQGRSTNFWPLFDAYHVDVTVSGHEHFYARSHPLNLGLTDGSYVAFEKGTVNVTPGGWGAPLSTEYPRWWNACGPISEYNFTVFDVSPTALHVTAINDNNSAIDEFTIRKGVVGSETVLRTRGEDSYADDVTGPPPLVSFGAGTYPPILSVGKVGKGAVAAGGLAWNCINDEWKKGQLDVLFDILFQHMVPGAKNVLWYEGYGVAHNAEACSDMVAALEALGYTVSGDATEPITPALLAGYDIVIIPQLRLGSPYVGGNPDLLPWTDVEALKDFVAGGKGLLVMDAHDYGGNNWARVQDKILEGVGAGMTLQSDGVYDWVDNWQGRGWQPMGAVDPSTDIGAAYVKRTGDTAIEIWEVSTVVPIPAFFLEKVPAGERTIVDGRRTETDARVIIETMAGGEGYVRIQKAPPSIVKKSAEVSYGAAEEAPATNKLVVVDVSTDVPSDLIKWPITVEVYYSQDAFDASGIASEEQLALYYWDIEQGMWRLCPESGVNTVRNCVTAAAYHLTRFAILPKK